jgi:glyoxalase family protein
MALTTSGLHHITAIASDPQRNLDFYAGLLGLRFVKRTVNFDAPDTYHFYFGDAPGAPGTLLTFFPWPHAARGRRGAGEPVALSYSVPPGALGFWRARLEAAGVPATAFERFGELGLSLSDPDGMTVELIETTDDPATPWPETGIPAEFALRAFHSVTLTTRDRQGSADFLVGLLGYQRIGEEDGRLRYALPGDAPGRLIDLTPVDAELGRVALGAGSIHHVAFRTVDDAEQQRWRMQVAALGRPATPVQDRQYFRSIYFREPGGVLYEIATDGPGFAIDEDPAALGERLMLPPQYEERRAMLERMLPPLVLPATHEVELGRPGDH